MMLKLEQSACVYVANKPVDFRKAINGLAALVMEQFEAAVTGGSVYVFYTQLDFGQTAI